MKVGIVGGRGFIGSALSSELAGHEVVPFTRDYPLTSPEAADVVADLDALVWAASSSTPATLAKHPEYADVELAEFTETLGVLADLPEKRLIVLSSGGTVYGNSPSPHDESAPLAPVSVYGELKVRIEERLKELQPHATILRLSNVYGPGQLGVGGQGVLAHWMNAIAEGGSPVIYGDPEVARDYIYIGDAVRGIRLALETDVRGQIINLGSGYPTTLRELYAEVAAVTGIDNRPDIQPGRPYDNQSTWLQISRARELLDWEPTVTLGDGIRNMWEWKERK